MTDPVAHRIPRLRHLRRALLVTGLAACAAPAAAQPAATLAVDDPVYDLVDQLLARVPVRGVIVAQRPYSRRELARAARTFAAAIARRGRPDDRSTELLSTLVAAIGDTTTGDGRGARRRSPIRLRPLESATLSIVASGTAPRPVQSTGLGGLDALTVPALDARGGRPVVHGAVTSIETAHAVGVGAGLALVVQPRVSWLGPTDGDQSVSVRPQRLFVRGVWRNAALQAGVDAARWGQGGARGLFLADNAPPLHAITLATDAPVTLPWVLRVIGPLRASGFIADLGRGQNFPHAKLAGYKVGATPWPRFEIGAGIVSQFGGHGAPALSTGQRIADLFPYVTWIHPGTDRPGDKLASNKLANGDVRLQIPELAGLTLSYEAEMDDLDFRRIHSMLWQDTGHLLAARFGALDHAGTLSLDLQLHHTSIRLYEHAQFTSGVTYDRGLLGDPLGPNAAAGYASLAWRPTPLVEYALRAAVERRDASQYESRTDNAHEDNFRFVVVQSRPLERRARFELAARRTILGALGYSARAGVERVTNEGFVARPASWDGYVEAGIGVRR
ncbi:MAG: hypothetical protein JO180_11125 [Gemmatirosa sp.]|nr:hypothetical protein [Gemmatirosa sp.]